MINIYVYIYIYIYIYIFKFIIYFLILSICLISKRKFSIGQTLIKIKHKVKWVVKVVKTRNLLPPLPQHHSPSSHVDSFRHLFFTFFVNILKTFFEKTKIQLFLKICPIFFILTTSTNIKIHKAKF